MATISTTDTPPVTVPLEPEKRSYFGKIRDNAAAYIYILPSLIIMMVVIAYPIFFTIRLSFYNTGRGLDMDNKQWIGLQNYENILRSDSFRVVTSNTLEWTILSTLGAFVLGFGAALVVQREFIGRGLVRGILLVPWVISAVSAAYVWRWLYHSDWGLISGVLTELGLIDQQINFLDNVDRAMPSLVVANIWKEFPFVMIMMLAGLQTVPEALHRAAQVDGAGTWDRFWHVTMPQLKSVTIITLLLLVVANLNSFTLVYIMTAGGPAGATEIWITEIYKIAFQKIRFDVAAAYSVILFIVMMSVGYFYVKALTRGDEARRS